MLVGLFLASTLIQPSVSGQPTLAAKLTDAIDHNYLYADGESWKRLRPALLQNADSTVASIDRELTELHDGGLRDCGRHSASLNQQSWPSLGCRFQSQGDLGRGQGESKDL
jgi:hypothetical protein